MEIPVRKRLIELSGERVFSRGEDYFAWRRVHALESDVDKITARVYGGGHYLVTIKIDGGAIYHKCDCPEGLNSRFCKHCVAVCLQAAKDDARDSDTDECRRLIEFASQAAASECDAESFLPWLIDVETTLNDFIEAGYAEEAATLIEAAPIFFMLQQTEAGERLIAVLLAVHHKSRIRLVAESHARRLLRWQMSLAAEMAGEVMRQYLGLLCVERRKEYARLVRLEWDRLRMDGESVEPERGAKFDRLAEILEKLAEGEGDIDLLIYVKSFRLDTAYDYLAIAQLCKGKGSERGAIEWAERGRNNFQAKEAVQLYEFLAAEYQAAGEMAKALEIVCELFSADPSLDLYRRMEAHARKIGEWDRRREQALSVARRYTNYPEPRIRSLRDPAHDRSVLVSIFIWENDIKAALREAHEGGCSDDLWCKLARRLAGTQPDEALKIYKRLVTRYAQVKNCYAYRQAIEVLRMAGYIMKKQKRRDEYLAYVSILRRKYRGRHRFTVLLDQVLARHSRHRIKIEREGREINETR